MSLEEMLKASVPEGHYRLSCKDVDQMSADVHYHHQLIVPDESDMIIMDQYQVSLTPEERDIMIKYHDLVLKLHCESWVAST